MKTYKEILNSKSTQQIRLITIHNILNDIDMNLLIEKAKYPHFLNCFLHIVNIL